MAATLLERSARRLKRAEKMSHRQYPRPHSGIGLGHAQYASGLGLNLDYRVFFDAFLFQVVWIHVGPVERIFLSCSWRVAVGAVHGFQYAATGQPVFETSVGLLVQHELQLSRDVWRTQLQSRTVVLGSLYIGCGMIRTYPAWVCLEVLERHIAMRAQIPYQLFRLRCALQIQFEPTRNGVVRETVVPVLQRELQLHSRGDAPEEFPIVNRSGGLGYNGW